MDFRVLGALEVHNGDHLIAVGRARERNLLLLLLMNANRTLTDDMLIDQLWGDAAPRNPRAALQTAVSRLRTSLGQPPSLSPLRRSGNGYLLSVTNDQVDSLRFEDLVAQSRKEQDANTAAALLEEALGLWRGPPYADIRFEEFAQPEIRRLEELHLEASEMRIQNAIDRDHHRQVIGELEALVLKFPLRESLWAKLMIALHRADRQTEALRTYQRARTAMADAGGLEPGAELARLEEAILIGELSPAEINVTATAHPIPQYRTNLPREFSSFVGRTADLTALEEMVHSHRLISLVGPAGVGKTRLASELAGNLRAKFSGGVFIISLEKVADDEQVVDVATTTLSTATRNITDIVGLIELLRSAPTLLIFDNCEHVLSGTSSLIGRILTETRQTTIIGTSRRRLGLGAERVWYVEPLPVAGTDRGDLDETSSAEPALQLFLDRVAAIRPDLPPTDPDTIRAGRSIVETLDGLPLAIELAASQCFALAPLLVSQQLERDIGVSANHDPLVPARHKTVGAAVSWSLQHLSEDQRACFTALSVVADTFNITAAIALCGKDGREDNAVGLVSNLIEHSLIARVDHGGGEPRFRMLRPIRAIAQNLLKADNQFEETNLRYARWMADAVPSWGPIGQTTDIDRWREIEKERWNLWGSIDWALADNPELALRLLVGSSSRWILFRDRWRAVHAIQRALATTSERTIDRARALRTLAFLTTTTVHRSWMTRKANRFDLPILTGTEHLPRREELESLDPIAYAVEATEIADELDESIEQARARLAHGYALVPHGRLEEAEQLISAALPAAVADNAQWTIATMEMALSRVLFARGDYFSANRHAAEALRLYQESGEFLDQMIALDSMGRIALAHADTWEAADHFRRAIKLGSDRVTGMEADLRVELGYAALACDDPESAGHEFGRALAISRRLGYRRLVGTVRVAQAHLAIKTNRRDSAQGYLEEAMSVVEEFPDRVAEAYILGLWGALQHRRGDRLGAVEMFRRSLAVQENETDEIAVARAMEGLAAVATTSGDHRHAATLLGAAAKLRVEHHTPGELWMATIAMPEIPLSGAEYGEAARTGRDLPFWAAVKLATD